jgi:hypothetical protein
VIFTILPFCPSVLWGQLIASRHGWRYVGLLCAVWAFVGLVMTAVFYFPPPRVNAQGLTKKQLVGQIDFVGGFLSVTGMIVFLAGLQWGGYQVRLDIPSSLAHLSWLTCSRSIHGHPLMCWYLSCSVLRFASPSSSGRSMAPSARCSHRG